MGPRNPDEPIGEFPTLAFVQNKNFSSAPNVKSAMGAQDLSGSGSAQDQAIAAL